MRSTNAAFGLVAAAAFLLASCAYVVDPDAPTVVTALSQDQLATLRLKGLVSTAAPGMGPEDLTRLTEAVRTEIAYESPGIFVEEPKATDSHALTMRLQFTTYSFSGLNEGTFGTGNGTVQVSGCMSDHTVAANVQLVDDSNIVKGLYRVEKHGDFQCVFTIDVITTGFAKNVAEIMKNVAAESTQNTKIIDAPITGLNTTPQLNGRIALLLTPSFANYWLNAPLRSMTDMRTIDRLSLGETLSNHASDSMRALFRDLKIVYRPLPAGSPPTLVLVPKVTSAYAGIGRGRFGDRPVSITIQWTLQNQNGVEIWSDTVRGNAHGDLAGVASGPVDSWMHDFGIAAAIAFRTSKERMASSPEVLTALKAVQ